MYMKYCHHYYAIQDYKALSNVSKDNCFLYFLKDPLYLDPYSEIGFDTVKESSFS